MTPPPLPIEDSEPLMAVVVRQEEVFAGGLTVRYSGTSSYDLVTGATVFEGEVEAQFGPTALKASRLVIDESNRTGRAEGTVELSDPIGWLRAESLDFDWEAKTGRAESVELRAGNVRLWVDTLEVLPELWRLGQTRVTLSREEDPWYAVRTDSVDLYPGDVAVARGVGLDLLGLRLGEIPTIEWSLDRRVEGLQLPEITFRRGAGLGLEWFGATALTDSTVVRGTASSFPGVAPSYGAQVSLTGLSADESSARIEPNNDLGERFGESWLDTIDSKAPADERDRVSERRETVSLETRWNAPVVGRLVEGDQVSKAIDLAAEWGGGSGPISGFLTSRLQVIRPDSNSDFLLRAVNQATALGPKWRLGESTYAQLRADAFVTGSDGGLYGWTRGLASVVSEPLDWASFGFGLSTSEDYGSPDFAFDPLTFDSLAHLRADFQFGPTTARYLAKWDLDANRWASREYELAWVFEAFEPYVVVRENPSVTQIGVRVRLGIVGDQLVSRDPSRQ